MTNTIRSWLAAVTNSTDKDTIVRRAALGVAGLAIVGGAVAGPAIATQATAVGTTAPAAVVQQTPAKQANTVGFQYQQQPNFYYCGPASTRIALTAQGEAPSQTELADQLGTTVNGTNSVVDIARVLNTTIGTNAYTATSIPGEQTSAEQIAKFRADAVKAVDSGRVVVSNVVGTATNEDGRLLTFPGGHYITVVGYADHGQKMKIADPAQPIGAGIYWMSTTDLANWMATRGYTA